MDLERVNWDRALEATLPRLYKRVDENSADGVGFLGRLSITEIKESKSGNGDIRLVGFAGTSELDRHEDVVAHGAYSKHLRMYLETNPQVLWQHDHGAPIGRAVEARETDQGLHVVDVIPELKDAEGSDELQRFVRMRVKAGMLRTLSIGAIVHGREWVEGTEAQAKGVDSFRRLTDLELVEHSLVTIPANRGATFQVVAGLRRQVAAMGADWVMRPKTAAEQMRGAADLVSGWIAEDEARERAREASRSMSIQVPIAYKAAPDMSQLADSLRGLGQQLTDAAQAANDIADSLGADPQQDNPSPPDGQAAQAFWQALGVTG